MNRALQAWIDGSDVPPVASWMGIRLLSAGQGEAEAEMAVRDGLFNAMGTLHGGVFCDLADAAMGAAIASRTETGETFTTTDLSVHLFAPLRDGTLRARARLVRRGRQTGYAECDLVTESGTLAARASCACLFFVPADGET